MSDFTDNLTPYKLYEEDDIDGDGIKNIKNSWVIHFVDELFRLFVVLLIAYFSFVAGQMTVKIEAMDAGAAKIVVDNKGNEKFQFFRAR